MMNVVVEFRCKLRHLSLHAKLTSTLGPIVCGGLPGSRLVQRVTGQANDLSQLAYF